MYYSAIIVLGNRMNKEGQLNIESSSRMNLAIEIFHENQEPHIVTCGWAYRADSPIALADAMKNYAIKMGKITPELILTEKNSRDTVGDAIFTKNNISKIKGWRNIIVVTSDYHVSRAHIIFNYVYGGNYNIKIIGATTGIDKEQSRDENGSLMAFYETFDGIEAGNDVLIHERLCKEHPFYNGVIHPKISIK